MATENILLFADNQVIFARTENYLQIATQLPNKTIANYNLETTSEKNERAWDFVEKIR
jgi:hypothetical protein